MPKEIWSTTCYRETIKLLATLLEEDKEFDDKQDAFDFMDDAFDKLRQQFEKDHDAAMRLKSEIMDVLDQSSPWERGE